MWAMVAVTAAADVDCGRAVCGGLLRGDRYETRYDRQIAIGEQVDVPLDAAPRYTPIVDPARADLVTVELRTRSAVVLDDGGWSLVLDGFRDGWSAWVAISPVDDGGYPLTVEVAAPLPAPFAQAELVEATLAHRGPAGPRWEELAADCALGLDALDGTCFYDRVGAELKITAYRDGQVVDTLIVPFTHPVGC
ncbi:MAG: hypothetical protein ABMB14_14400 [Myxococcota bacterium]